MSQDACLAIGYLEGSGGGASASVPLVFGCQGKTSCNLQKDWQQIDQRSSNSALNYCKRWLPSLLALCLGERTYTPPLSHPPPFPWTKLYCKEWSFNAFKSCKVSSDHSWSPREAFEVGTGSMMGGDDDFSSTLSTTFASVRLLQGGGGFLWSFWYVAFLYQHRQHNAQVLPLLLITSGVSTLLITPGHAPTCRGTPANGSEWTFIMFSVIKGSSEERTGKPRGDTPLFPANIPPLFSKTDGDDERAEEVAANYAAVSDLNLFAWTVTVVYETRHDDHRAKEMDNETSFTPRARGRSEPLGGAALITTR
ncbi:hypothetical protein EYF80_049100 [Liparis tanakae]|uniref:Uncharacterized protein n=1 Tax=Liparis tanakae TaxID=230148 RepID=A0A4Z2FII0_9TELE|nr:hypothetical protein EYF80_049100 [Liparis tanakae]